MYPCRTILLRPCPSSVVPSSAPQPPWVRTLTVAAALAWRGVAWRDSFPDVDEIPSLYEVLGVQPGCSDDHLKRAYRRLSLLHHPDKVAAAAAAAAATATASDSKSDADRTAARATLRFQQIGFAYSVLKDPARRERYDATGSTAELSAGGAKTEAEWRDYFRELWSGEVSAHTIDEFKKKYQGAARPGRFPFRHAGSFATLY